MKTNEYARLAVAALALGASMCLARNKVRPASRTAEFTDLVKGRPVYPALSGRTMEFDGSAKCVAGC